MKGGNEAVNCNVIDRLVEALAKILDKNEEIVIFFAKFAKNLQILKKMKTLCFNLTNFSVFEVLVKDEVLYSRVTELFSLYPINVLCI